MTQCTYLLGNEVTKQMLTTAGAKIVKVNTEC